MIGLEVHIQLNTRSKLFSSAASTFGERPNHQVGLLDAGMPGALPTLNSAAVEKAILFGMAINADIASVSWFERKSYFYPDLPKGFQITQQFHPILSAGSIPVPVCDGKVIDVEIEHAHLEEDAGKSTHDFHSGTTAIDLNRSGTPLLEVVTKPHLRSAKQAAACFREIRALACWLDICDGVLAHGNLRCDANVSVRRRGETQPAVRTEIKNLNSFRFLEAAIDAEIERQIQLRRRGEPVQRQTLFFDPQHSSVFPLRDKERRHDYRYCIEPDLLPVKVDRALIDRMRAKIPELPHEKAERFTRVLELDRGTAVRLCVDLETAVYFETVERLCGAPREAANWVLGELRSALRRAGLANGESLIDPHSLAGIISRVRDGSLPSTLAKEVFAIACATGKPPEEIIREHGMAPFTDGEALRAMVNEVLAANAVQVEEFGRGKTRVFSYLVGQVLYATAGKADPRQIRELLKRALEPVDQQG